MLQRRAIYGEALTIEDIAAWAGCSPSYIAAIQARALAKVRRAFVNGLSSIR